MERIGEQVERTLARSGSRNAVPLRSLVAVWPDAVGDAVARNAWPLRLGRDGTLHVAASSATWAYELDRMSAEVLEALRLRMGDAAPPRLRFAVGPVPEPGAAPASETPETPPEVSREIDAEASRAASGIEDPELRELVARAARASLVRARSGRPF